MKPQPWCPVAAAIAVIGGKWKPSILLQLRHGPVRFNELRRRLPHVTQRVLTLHLRELEADGIIARRVEETVPPQVDYAFTTRGLTLGPLLETLEQWGEANRPSS